MKKGLSWRFIFFSGCLVHPGCCPLPWGAEPAMSKPRSATLPLPGDPNNLDQLVERFELAWQAKLTPRIEEFVPADQPGRQQVLHELVKIDLEYRWRQPGGGRPRLEDYVKRLPQLGPLRRLGVDLIGEEYRVRQRWGDRPGRAEYASRFPRQAAALWEVLERIDAELEGELATQCLHARRAAPASPPGERTASSPSRRLGRYELGELLGTGAFGTVWQAWDTELKREVAVKLPRNGQRVSPQEEERFLREARSAAGLHHPGIVAVHDAGREGQTLYLVSELVRGVSLEEWRRRGCVSFVESAGLVAQVAEALHHAHRQGVVHRDVKPSNILLVGPSARFSEGRLTEMAVKIADFGLALRDAGEVTLTLDGQVLGTPAYMSPEQVHNPHAVDGRSDVYSLGVILYELLTGELPFRGPSQTLLLQVVSEEPRAPSSLNERVPRDLETICLKCLRKEPGQRYATAAALAADLRRWLAGEPIRARRVGWGERLWLWAKRNPVPIVTGGLGAAALLAASGAPAAAILGVIAAAAVLFGLQRAKTAAVLRQSLEDVRRRQEKAAGTAHFALEHCSRARAERDRAVAGEGLARRRFGHLRELARGVLFDIAEEIGASPARAVLVRTARSYLDALAGEAGDDPLLLRELAVGYGRLAEVEQDAARALESQRRSVELFERLARAHPENAQAERDLAASRDKVAERRRTVVQERRGRRKR
jgi:tRNA A-37 threonylcarbamoyl transferase component Bud32